MNAPRIDVAVIAYKSGRFLPRLVDDLKAFAHGPISVDIWDNTGIQRNLSAVKNLMAARRSAPYVMPMNADVAVCPGWDDLLVGFLERNPAFGVVLPLPAGDARHPEIWKADITASELGTEAPPARGIMEELAARLRPNGDAHLKLNLDGMFCPFFAPLIRREVLAPLRGFDERFRLFGGDRDFHRRVETHLGKAVGALRSCPFFHAGGGSIGEASGDPAAMVERERAHRHEMYPLSLEKPWHLLGNGEIERIRRSAKFRFIPSGSPHFPGVRVVHLTPHPDARGTLVEVFRKEWAPEMPAAQVNLMKSLAGSVRGSHVHREHFDWLIMAEGSALVGMRDVRESSPFFGRTALLEINETTAVVIPPGVAHVVHFPQGGILATVESIEYDAEEDAKVRWEDLGIPWPVDFKVPGSQGDGLSLKDLLSKVSAWQPLWKTHLI